MSISSPIMNPGTKKDSLGKLFERAEKKRKKRKYLKAIELYFQYLDLDARNSQIWISLAYSYNKIGEFKKAIWASRQALEREERSEGALNNLFYSYDLTGEYKLALSILKRYLRIRFQSKTLMSEKEFNMKYNELIKDLRFRGFFFKENNVISNTEFDLEKLEKLRSEFFHSLFKDEGITPSNRLIKINPNSEIKIIVKNQGTYRSESITTFVNTPEGKISKALKESPDFSKRSLGLLPSNDRNISSFYLENNIEFHILTLFEDSNIGNTDYLMRLLKLILRFFPFNKKACDKLDSTIKKLENDKKKKQIEETKIQKEGEFREKIIRIMKVSTRVKLDRLQEVLNIERTQFNNKIFEWAEEFDFKIDGDYLVVNQDTLSRFISSLTDKEL